MIKINIVNVIDLSRIGLRSIAPGVSKDREYLMQMKNGKGNLSHFRVSLATDPENLIALCSSCHDLHTRGQIPKGAIVTWKQMLMLVAGSPQPNALLDSD